MITLANGEKIVLGDKKQQLIGEDGTLLNLDSAVVEYKGKQKRGLGLPYTGYSCNYVGSDGGTWHDTTSAG